VTFNGREACLSQILEFLLSLMNPTSNPGIVDLPYRVVFCPATTAALVVTQLACGAKDLDALLPRVEQFARSNYGRALAGRIRGEVAGIPPAVAPCHKTA